MLACLNRALLSILVAIGVTVSASRELRAQVPETATLIQRSAGEHSRQAEVVISIRIDRMFGRIDVTTTIPVDHPSAVPRSRHEAPAEHRGRVSRSTTSGVAGTNQAIDLGTSDTLPAQLEHGRSRFPPN